MTRDPRDAAKNALDKSYKQLLATAQDYLKRAKKYRKDKEEERALELEALAVKYIKEVKNWYVAAKPPKSDKPKEEGFWAHARIDTASPPRAGAAPGPTDDEADAFLERFDPGAGDPAH